MSLLSHHFHLAERLPGQHRVNKQRRGLHHAPGPAARAEAPALAAEGHQSFRVAPGAADAQEAVLQPAALQVGLEHLLHEGRQAAAVPLQGRQERRVVLLDQLIDEESLQGGGARSALALGPPVAWAAGAGVPPHQRANADPPGPVANQGGMPGNRCGR